MKKALTITGLAVAVALSSHAQGYVIFSSSTQNISTNNDDGLPGGIGKTQGQGNYYYGLFWSPTISSGAPLQGYADLAAYAFYTAGWTYDGDPTAIAATTATPGRFFPIAPNPDESTTVPGTTGGDSYHFVIVGWSANLGSTLAQMEANLLTVDGYIGQSAVSGLIQTGNGSNIPPSTIMGGLVPQIQAFTLAPEIPEPGTLALAALGGTSLLLFRRKK